MQSMFTSFTCRLALGFVTVAGDVARKYIQDPELLRFIDLECFIWSTVNADMTPMINAGDLSDLASVTWQFSLPPKL
jgi:hypothetical protein